MQTVSRKIDKLGRITLPIDFRKSLNMEKLSEIVISVEGTTIIIRKSPTVCRLCFSEGEIANSKLCVCKSCIERLKKS